MGLDGPVYDLLMTKTEQYSATDILVCLNFYFAYP